MATLLLMSVTDAFLCEKQIRKTLQEDAQENGGLEVHVLSWNLRSNPD